jgi:uncharacterized protein
MILRKAFLILVVISATVPFAIVSCDDEPGSQNDFDRTVMLQNYADHIIKPQLGDLQSSVNTLKTSADLFADEPNEENLIICQNAWIEAYSDWQFVNAFNFGPGGEEGLRKGLVEEAGTFPVSVTKIENNITAGTSNMDDFNRDARGFLAIEYLIFNLSDNRQEILSGYESTNRRAYLKALVQKLKTQIDAVVVAWNSDYTAEFVSNDGTDVGSSTSHLYNEFVRSFEAIKNFKVALPLGLRPGQTQTEPQLVEAYYSGKSVTMAKLHLTAIENIWEGKSRSGVDGVGFKEYLLSVTGGSDLIASTEAQLANVKAALNTIPEDQRLSILIESEFSDVEALHTELQKQTRFFKSDMSSLLGIAITFSSGDGD